MAGHSLHCLWPDIRTLSLCASSVATCLSSPHLSTQP